jgi:hypothetical protein
MFFLALQTIPPQLLLRLPCKKIYVLLDFFSIERRDGSPRELDMETRAGFRVIRTLNPELFSCQCVIFVQMH